METPTSMGAGVEAKLPKKAKMFQEWPYMNEKWRWMPQCNGASVEASPKDL